MDLRNGDTIASVAILRAGRLSRVDDGDLSDLEDAELVETDVVGPEMNGQGMAE
jgi:hypothetical protein